MTNKQIFTVEGPGFSYSSDAPITPEELFRYSQPFGQEKRMSSKQVWWAIVAAALLGAGLTLCGFAWLHMVIWC